MSVNLITGYAGTAHITSAGDGAVNAGMFGSGKYVLNIGEKFGYEVINNNLIRIKSGYAINQGRKIELAVNDYEEVEIDNGLQGVKRCDLIVMHYEKSLTTGIETATMKVIKGTSGDDYTDPAYTSGDILNGANEDDFLLYRVKIDGLNIDAVEPIFSVTNSILELLETKIDDSNRLTKSAAIKKLTQFGCVADAVITKHILEDMLTEENITNSESDSDSTDKAPSAQLVTDWITKIYESIKTVSTSIDELKTALRGSIKSVSSGAAGSLGSGLYYLGSNVTGVPLSSGGMLICSEASASGNKVQIFFSISTSAPYEIYKRTYNGTTSTWGNWYALGIEEANKWHALNTTATFKAGSATATVSVSGVTAGAVVMVQRTGSSAMSKYIIGASAGADTDTVTIVLNDAVTTATTINVSIMYYC